MTTSTADALVITSTTTRRVRLSADPTEVAIIIAASDRSDLPLPTLHAHVEATLQAVLARLLDVVPEEPWDVIVLGDGLDEIQSVADRVLSGTTPPRVRAAEFLFGRVWGSGMKPLLRTLGPASNRAASRTDAWNVWFLARPEWASELLHQGRRPKASDRPRELARVQRGDAVALVTNPRLW